MASVNSVPLSIHHNVGYWQLVEVVLLSVCSQSIFSLSNNEMILLIRAGNDSKPMTLMSATLSYDEEAVSSVDAAKFMSTLQSLLESPTSLLL